MLSLDGVNFLFLCKLQHEMYTLFVRPKCPIPGMGNNYALTSMLLPFIWKSLKYVQLCGNVFFNYVRL